MQAAGRNRKQVFNEINITPLTDIFLVLLIIMMVVAPMMQQVRQDIKPPSLRTGSALEPNTLTVEVTEKGVFYVQSLETKVDDLMATLKEQQALLTSKSASEKAGSAAADAASPAAASEKMLIIRADKATKSGQILKVFEAARDAGFTKVTMAGEPLNEDRKAKLQQENSGGTP